MASNCCYSSFSVFLILLCSFDLQNHATGATSESVVTPLNSVHKPTGKEMDSKTKDETKGSGQVTYVERPHGRFGFGTIPMPNIPGITIVDPVTDNETKIWATPGTTTTTVGSSAVLVKKR